MYTQNLFNTNNFTIDDILNLKEQLITHYCFVHDEELKQEIEKIGLPQIEVKITQYVEKGKIILVDKKML